MTENNTSQNDNNKKEQQKPPLPRHNVISRVNEIFELISEKDKNKN